MDRTDITFNDLKDRQKERARRRQQLRARRESERRPGWITRRRLDRAANGIEGQPVCSRRQDRILVDTGLWATWIHEASRAFDRCPGLGILDEKPLPDEGLGIEAGRRILDLAASGASLEEVVELLRNAREALGPWQSDRGASPLAEADTELGIWMFFRQLHRYWTGSSWEPPLIRKAGKSRVLAAGVTESPPRRSARRATPRLSQGCRRVLDVLSGDAMSAKEIATAIIGNPRRASTVRYWISQLRKAGIAIETDQYRGYWLLSDPPVANA